MTTKRTLTFGAPIIHGKDIDNEVEQSSSKKYKGSFQYRVSFKIEWKGSHPVKIIKNGKCKFDCLPCRKNLLSHHLGRDYV